MRMCVVRSRSRLMNSRRPAAPGRVLALFADRADVVVAGVQLRQHARDLLRRILQVGIERDHVAAAGVRKPGQDRPVLAKVRREQHHARDLGAQLELLAQYRDRTIAAAVVDEDDLVAAAERVERRVQAREQRRQHFLLVVDGNDQRQVGLPVHGRELPAALRLGARVAAAARAGASAASTRSTSPSCMAGNIGRLTMLRPMRSACGKSPGP